MKNLNFHSTANLNSGEIFSNTSTAKFNSAKICDNKVYYFICSSYALNLICEVQYFYGHNYDWKNYIENIFIENGNTMFSLQFKKQKINQNNVETS